MADIPSSPSTSLRTPAGSTDHRSSDERRISIVIPTKNSQATLPLLLRSIRLQSVAPREVIVVDTESTDKTKAIALSYSATVLSDLGGGDRRSAARNRGAQYAQGVYVLFLDSDMELPPDTLRKLGDLAAGGAEAVVIPERSIAKGMMGVARNWERAIVQRFDYLVFARLLKRSVFLQSGGFDEGMGHLEDLDLQARLLEGGTCVVRTEVEILHHEERLNWFSLVRRQVVYSLDTAEFCGRHPRIGGLIVSIPGRLRAYVGAVRGPKDWMPLALVVTVRTVALFGTQVVALARRRRPDRGRH